jgi:hypothetical protein
MVTRGWLRSLITEGDLDEASYALVTRVLEKCTRGSFALFSFDLAVGLGAEMQEALEAASLSELIYAAVDYADDLEDGDAAGYLAEVPEPIRVNLSHQLLALAMARAVETESILARPGLARACGRALCAAASGQRAELTREGWSAETYARVAEWMGGRQFECYLRAAAAGARVGDELLVPIARPLAITMLSKHDEASGDARLLSLPAATMEALREQARQELRSAAAALPEAAGRVVERLINLAARPSVSGASRGKAPTCQSY